jgi:hypothetical protein
VLEIKAFKQRCKRESSVQWSATSIDEVLAVQVFEEVK